MPDNEKVVCHYP